MIVAVGHVYALLPRRAAAEREMVALQTEARRQDGCLLFAFAEAVGDPGHFLVVQRWRDQASLEAHYRSPVFASYQAAIGELLVRESELELHRVEETVRPVNSSTLDLDQDD